MIIWVDMSINNNIHVNYLLIMISMSILSQN
jgi:hypothetical protein